MSPGWYRSLRRTMARSPSWRLGSMLLPVTTTYDARPPSCAGAATTQTARTSVRSAPEKRSDNHRRDVEVKGCDEGTLPPRHSARVTCSLTRTPYDCATTTRSSSEAATVACGLVVLQVMATPTLVQAYQVLPAATS